MTKIGKLLVYLKYYVLGKIYLQRYYDKRIMKSRWFQGPYKSFGTLGWRWVVDNSKINKKTGYIENAKWPVNHTTKVVHYQNIHFDYDDLNIFQSPGCYFQAIGEIFIGKGTWIGPNVGIITANHDTSDLNKHREPKNVVIGKECWIGMNSVILPGVELGDKTIVGAGSVVTKSFVDGHCLIAGVPAKIVKKYES